MGHIIQLLTRLVAPKSKRLIQIPKADTLALFQHRIRTVLDVRGQVSNIYAQKKQDMELTAVAQHSQPSLAFIVRAALKRLQGVLRQV